MSAEKRPQNQAYESDAEDVSSEEQQYQPPPPQQRRRGQRTQQRQQQQQQQQQGGGGLLQGGPLESVGLDNVGQTAGGLVQGATGALGGVAGNAVNNQQQGGGKSDTLRLRLDLNLDVEITLKAKIHGDLELALLET